MELTKKRSWAPSPSKSKNTTPEPIVSGRYFFPKAPFVWRNVMPEALVTSVKTMPGAPDAWAWSRGSGLMASVAAAKIETTASSRLIDAPR